jgi:hypothetical protein
VPPRGGRGQVGSIKDEQKIKEKVAERRASYEAGWIDGAALRPETARVLAIGVLPFKVRSLSFCTSGRATGLTSFKASGIFS